MVTRIYFTHVTLLAFYCSILLFLSNSSGALPLSMPYYLPKSLRNLAHDFSSKSPVDKVLEKSAIERVIPSSYDSDQSPVLAAKRVNSTEIATTIIPQLPLSWRRKGTHRRKHTKSFPKATLRPAIESRNRRRKKLPKSRNPICYFTSLPCVE
ncbi:hypothetical protein DdX_18146 [Ditylenchus destructor]|uniref:Uncharacterized protein n=1 Tax=Ditylenchus destructor TaxID=166010 RepID=A0AAD4MQK6_9BILA|nr:hypothetical protein DdX_18146 [Ditylenchus destructor]